jgi:acetyl esterase/lipase
LNSSRVIIFAAAALSAVIYLADKPAGAATPADVSPDVPPSVVAPPAVVLPIWPEAVTRAAAAKLKEKVLKPTGDGVYRPTNIAVPTIAVYPAPGAADGAPAPAMLICPGGGYKHLAYNKEGSEVAQWLNTLGITGVVLKYRVPDDRTAAFQDAQRAMSLIRQHAKEWNINPERVGFIGFSAGGHLGARLSTDFNRRSYTPVDEADARSCRPDFAVIMYPAYLVKEGNAALTEELPVSPQTPPSFIVQTQDDIWHVENSLCYALALRRAGVQAELHLYPIGGHGYALRPCKYAVGGWAGQCRTWLQTIGVIPSAAKPKEDTP